MHELSLCGSIYRIVERAAAGRPVSVVRLQVGQLRQVVPATLSYCWTLVCEATPLAGSVLDIESVPVEARCDACGTSATIRDTLVLVCPACGSAALTLTAGEEFLLTSLDLAEV
ncbi:hydrogenase maturation nickel metallochaperone HypA [Cryptosporangium sp. NPDC051539]|uniref:hydrogenase maturation nickel metallochaperone HypA n=1 Tax=Cryptosporangium sp. NPDC051539 TaxID=3363962 RepID=UPI00379B03EA